jgi:hypothetical protein
MGPVVVSGRAALGDTVGSSRGQSRAPVFTRMAEASVILAQGLGHARLQDVGALQHQRAAGAFEQPLLR